MKIGVSAFAWTSRFERKHLELLPSLKAMGLDGFEIPLFEPSRIDPPGIRRAFEASGLECTICAILPAGINPISPDPAVRKVSLRHLVECVETAAACGARILGGPLYAPIGYLPEHRPNADEQNWAVEIFQRVCEIAENHHITISIEPVNRSETFFLRTAAEAQAFCRAVGHHCIGVTIDTFHANIEEKNIAEAVKSLGPYLKHLHVSENDRGMLGQGHVDFPGILAGLQSIGYNGYLMIEGFGYAPGVTEAPGALWADMTVSPEKLASEGAKYLRNLMSRSSKGADS